MLHNLLNGLDKLLTQGSAVWRFCCTAFRITQIFAYEPATVKSATLAKSVAAKVIPLNDHGSLLRFSIRFGKYLSVKQVITSVCGRPLENLCTI